MTMRHRASTMKPGTSSSSFAGQKHKHDTAAHAEAPPKKTWQAPGAVQSGYMTWRVFDM